MISTKYITNEPNNNKQINATIIIDNQKSLTVPVMEQSILGLSVSSFPLQVGGGGMDIFLV